MGVTKINRKDLAVLLRHPKTNKIRMAISRKYLIENKNGLIDIHAPSNRKWLENQISIARRSGLVVDIDFEEQPINEQLDKKRNATPKNEKPGWEADLELKIARTELIRDQTITAKLNREIALGNYLRTSDVRDSVKVYLDQIVNIANTNISNEITKLCKEYGIKSAEDIVRLKSRFTEQLNVAIESGREEVTKLVDRMVAEQVEKLAKK